MTRIEKLRAEMESVVAEAQAQEEYDALTEEYRNNPNDDLNERRKAAATKLQEVRAVLRDNRVEAAHSPGDVDVAPGSIVAKTKMRKKES